MGEGRRQDELQSGFTPEESAAAAGGEYQSPRLLAAAGEGAALNFADMMAAVPAGVLTGAQEAITDDAPTNYQEARRLAELGFADAESGAPGTMDAGFTPEETAAVAAQKREKYEDKIEDNPGDIRALAALAGLRNPEGSSLDIQDAVKRLMTHKPGGGADNLPLNPPAAELRSRLLTMGQRQADTEFPDANAVSVRAKRGEVQGSFAVRTRSGI